MATRRKQRRGPRRPPPGTGLFFAFLEANGITYQAAATALHVSRVTAYQWAIGAKVPDDDHRDAIEVWTSGKVPRESWRRRSEQPRPVAPFRRTGTDG